MLVFWKQVLQDVKIKDEGVGTLIFFFPNVGKNGCKVMA